jgi:hypothetical protein
MAMAAGLTAGMTALGTMSSISAQQRQADAQRAQIEANQLAARDQLELNKKRLAWRKTQAEQEYMRERAIIDSQTDAARIQFDLAKAQQEAANIQQSAQRDIMSTQFDNQVQQMLAAASNTETQGSLQNAEGFAQLANALYNNRTAADAFTQRAIILNQDPNQLAAIRDQSLLQAIAQRQAVQNTANTISAVSGERANALRKSANITGQYGNLMLSYLDEQQGIQSRWQEFANAKMPEIMSLQEQRNLVAADAARYAKQAELNMAGTGIRTDYLNQSRISAAQSSMVQQPNILSSLAGLATNLSPLIADRVVNAPQSSPYSFSGPSFQSSSRQFTSPQINYALPQLDYGRGVTTDVTGNIFG